MKTVSVVAAVILKDNKVFATKRGYGDFAGGWEFPGCKVEQGETPQQALAREIQEELDAQIVVGDHLVTAEYDYPTFHLSMGCYLCSLASDHLTLLEHSDACWVDLSSIDSLEWLPADVIVVDAIKAKHVL